MNKAEELRTKLALIKAKPNLTIKEKITSLTVDYAESCILLLAEEATAKGENTVAFSMLVSTEALFVQNEVEYSVIKRLQAKGFSTSLGSTPGVHLVDVTVRW